MVRWKRLSQCPLGAPASTTRPKPTNTLMVSKCQVTCRRPHCLWRSSFPSSGQRQGRLSRSESFVRLFVEQTPKKPEPVHRLQATVRLSAIVGILLLYTRKRIKTVPVEKDKATSCDSLLCASFGGSSRCASFPPLAHSHPSA